MRVATVTILSAIVVTLLGLMFLAVAVLGVSARPAAAQTAPQCGPWPDIAAGLQSRYGESVLFEGAPMPGQSGVIIMAKRDGTTWTALTLAPDGRTACLRAAGGGWRMGSAPPAGEEG